MKSKWQFDLMWSLKSIWIYSGTFVLVSEIRELNYLSEKSWLIFIYCTRGEYLDQNYCKTTISSAQLNYLLCIWPKQKKQTSKSDDPHSL